MFKCHSLRLQLLYGKKKSRPLHARKFKLDAEIIQRTNVLHVQSIYICTLAYLLNIPLFFSSQIVNA